MYKRQVKSFGGLFLALNYVDAMSLYVATGALNKSYDGIVEFGAQAYPTTAPGAFMPITYRIGDRSGEKPVSHVGVQASPAVSDAVNRFMGLGYMNLSAR